MNFFLCALYLFIFMLGTHWKISFLPDPWGSKLRYADAAFLLFFLAWILRRLKERKPFVRPPQLFPVLFFLASALISFFVSPKTGEGLTQAVGFIYLVTIYFVTCDALREDSIIGKAVYAWILSCAAVSAMTIVGIVLGFFWIPSDFVGLPGGLKTLIPFPRAEGLGYDTNAFAFYLHPALVFSLAIWLKHYKTRTAPRWLMPGFAVMSAAEILTVSRSIAGTLLSVILLLHFYPLSSKIKWAKRIVLTAFLMLLPAVVFVTVKVVMPVKIKRESVNGQPRLAVEWNRAPNHYFLTARASLQMLRDHPLFGIGIGNYRQEIRKYISKAEMDPYHTYFSDEIYRREGLVPHQVITGWMAKTGLVGLSAFLFLFGNYFRNIWQALKNQGRWQAKAIGAAGLGFLLISLVAEFITDRFFWFYLALTMSWLRSLSSLQRED